MPDTLLLADIGNTCVKIGLASHAGMDATYALPTRVRYTADSLGLSLLELLRHAERTPDDLTACVMCSVVPDFDVLFRRRGRGPSAGGLRGQTALSRSGLADLRGLRHRNHF